MARTKWHATLRERTRGKTQAQIAEKLGVGQSQISKYFCEDPDVPSGLVLANAETHYRVRASLLAQPIDNFGANDASQPETPQGDRAITGDPPRAIP